MSQLKYPKKGEYTLPKKNVLVLSCMDLRLTDNLLDFLNFDNLQNRYDHFILAGTSLLTTIERRELFLPGVYKKYSHWNETLENHLELAINLHQIKDIYIIEHEDCGAYSNLLNLNKVDLTSVEKEIKCHKDFSKELANRIVTKYKKHNLHVHSFFIDLRGNVSLLYTK